VRRKRRFRSRRRADEQFHSTPRVSAAPQLQTALRAGHLTPDVVMTLQRTIGNQAVIQLSGDEEKTGAAAQTEAEKRLKAIIESLNPAKKGDKGDSEQYKKALQASLKALMATDTGKALKQRAIDVATGKEGIPLAVLVDSAALAALFAANAGIPSIPDIPVGEGMSINIDIQGTMREPTGIKFTFKYKFGGGSKDERAGTSPDVTELPPALQEVLKIIDKRLISEWILARAYYEYETAGPDEEAAKKALFDELKADSDGLPDTHLVIEALARLLIEKAGENRIEFDLAYAGVWDSFSDLGGLVKMLKGIVDQVLPALPEPAQEVQTIIFKCGKKVIPIPIKKPEPQPEE
jgi:hypothetical protein